MTAPVTVTTADYEAVKAFFRDERTGLAVKFQLGAEPRVILEAFARHRQQAEAASAAQVAELREALGWYADTFCEGFGECVGDTCGKWSDDQCSGCKAFAILARAKSASEAEGV